MKKFDLEYIKNNIVKARKLAENSDYDLFEELYSITNNNKDISLLEIVLLGFDDSTNDSTYMYGLTHVFADIYKASEKKDFFNDFIPKINILSPHATNWARSIFHLWTTKIDDITLFTKEVKNNKIAIEFTIQVFDIILNETIEDGRDPIEIENVEKCKKMLNSI